EVDAAPRIADDVFVAAISEQTGVVAAGNQVQITVAVQVRPVGDVGRRRYAGQHATPEAALTLVLEVVERAGVARQNDVGAAIGVNIHDLHIARLARGERLFAERQ